VESRFTNRCQLLCFVLLSSMLSWPQSTAEIRARVQDEANAPVVSAFILLTAEDTLLMRAATTDDAVNSLPALPVVHIEHSAEGFVSFDAKGVRASIDRLQLDIVMGPLASGKP
jgi:hypothetical protein